MMHLGLDFVARRRRPWAWYLALAAAGVCGALMLAQYLQLQRETQRAAAQLARLETQSKQQQRAQLLRNAAAAALAARLKGEQQVAAALNYPWNNVLSTLELADLSGIAVLAFSHEQAGARSELTLEAADIDALSRFVDSLNEGADEGRRWYVSSYQVQQQANPVTLRAVVLNR
ncbi:hypothetical protein [Rugamonas aquatica]|uniref:Fimbrial assembly protein n=1 Tax=Rugamonas aquatica TaxID=2743357 RepID=A0A6A7MX62_9BURK|nr:hypothetical protein [Rugamonas aquatica]MQA37346.1 hypothetical protein [Rugamonas aquatica]